MLSKFQQLFDDTGLSEVKHDTATVYHGNLLHVLCDTVTLPNGERATREYIQHPGAVMAIPVFENGDVLVVRQYRYPLHRIFIEFPAGKKDAGELPLATGQRELLEETGYVAAQWQHMTDMHNAIGYCDEVIHIYIAQELTRQSEQNLDDNEFVDVMRVSLSELENWMRQGWVSDAKTQLGIFWLKDYLQNV